MAPEQVNFRQDIKVRHREWLKLVSTNRTVISTTTEFIIYLYSKITTHVPNHKINIQNASDTIDCNEVYNFTMVVSIVGLSTNVIQISATLVFALKLVLYLSNHSQNHMNHDSCLNCTWVTL